MKVACVAVLGALVACTRSYAPMHVTVETRVPPVLLAVRDATSTGWRGVATAGTSTFDLVVAGPYQVAVVCAPLGRGGAVEIDARSPSDPAVLEYPCSAGAAPMATVSGTMVNPGAAYLGADVAASATSNWSLSLRPELGVRDLVLFRANVTDPDDALGLPAWIALQRDLDVSGDLDLGTLDVAQDPGHALVETSFAFPDLEPGEQLVAGLELSTGTTRGALPAVLVTPLGEHAVPEWRIGLVPDAALRPSDRQTASVLAFNGRTLEGHIYETTRGVVRDLHVGDPVPALPEPLAPAAFDMAAHRVTVAWSSLGDYTDAVLAFVAIDVDHPLAAQVYVLGLSRGYIEDVGTAGATLDVTGVPGIPDDWQIDPTRWFDRELIVSRDVPGEPRTMRSVSEENPPRPRPADASSGVLGARSAAGRWWQRLRR